MPAPAPLPVAHPPPLRVTGLETARTSDATAYTGSEGLPDGAAAASATPTAAGGASGEGSASFARKAAAVPSALDADAEVAGGQHGGGREEGCERVDMLGRRKVYYTAEEVARHNHPGDCCGPQSPTHSVAGATTGGNSDHFGLMVWLKPS